MTEGDAAFFLRYILIHEIRILGSVLRFDALVDFEELSRLFRECDGTSANGLPRPSFAALVQGSPKSQL